MATARRIRPPDLFRASCSHAVMVGDMVFISGDRIGDVYSVDQCDISQENRRPWGIVISKSAPNECVVQTSGEVKSLYTGLTPGKHLFLGTGAGARLTQVFPGPALVGKLYHQIAGMATAADRFYLEIHQPVVLVSN